MKQFSALMFFLIRGVLETRFLLLLSFNCIGIIFTSFGQKTCTSSPTTISSNINFTSITWTPSGGATLAECNNMANGSASFTGNVVVDLANNRTLTISNNVNIIGNFPISGGPGSTLSVSGGGPSTTLHVTGNLGDAASNGVQYNVALASDHIIVDGTLFGKNNNAFTGSGTISGGTLAVQNGSNCGTPCPVSGGFSNCTSGDGFCTTHNVLPIELLSFKATKNVDKISLSWATASELNFDYFDVEKSSDGSGFHSIAHVKGNGTTNIRQDYSLDDEKPLLGKNYYRLKSVDFDGYTEYFNVLMVDFDGKRDFSVYPNPSDGFTLNVETNFMPQQTAIVTIYSTTGAEIAHFKINGSLSTLTLPVKLESGLYYARFISGEFSSVSSVLVK